MLYITSLSRCILWCNMVPARTWSHNRMVHRSPHTSHNLRSISDEQVPVPMFWRGPYYTTSFTGVRLRAVFHDAKSWPLCCISPAPAPSAIALLHRKWLTKTHEVLNLWISINLKSWSHRFKLLYITQLSYKRKLHNPRASAIELVTALGRMNARPYESCKICKGWPRRNAFSKLVHHQYTSFQFDRFLSVGNQEHNWVE